MLHPQQHNYVTLDRAALAQCSSNNVSMSSELTITDLSLVPGVTYYSTVTVCNSAGLCATATSDGVTPDLEGSSLITTSAGSIPTIASISPNVGILAGGARITVTGQNFPQRNVTMSFGDYDSISLETCSQTTCFVMTPPGSFFRCWSTATSILDISWPGIYLYTPYIHLPTKPSSEQYPSPEDLCCW